MNYMVNISEISFSSKERYKIEKIKFLKLSDEQIEGKSKKMITYDFTDKEKGGKVVGILEKGIKDYQLIIASSGITYFPEDSTSLFDLDHPNFDFIEVTEFLFENVNTSNVVRMNALFLGFEKITKLDLSSFSTSNVISMYEMFYGCSNLTELNLDYFDTVNVEDFSAMFGACSSLEKIKINHFNTKKAKQIYWMFSSCENLEELDLSNFETPNVEYMFEMFQACHSLSKLDISKMIFDNITLGDENNDRVFIEMPEDAVIIVKSEKERDFILELTKKHRPISWNKENVIIKENLC